MHRRSLQGILCFVLCPLLAAQQAAQVAVPIAPLPQQESSAQTASTPRYVTLPSGTDIELLAPGPRRFARQRPGTVVQFVLDRDVVLDGASLIHAGAPAEGVVEDFRRGSHFRHRAAEMDLRVTKLASGQPVELHLRCFDPAVQETAYDDSRPDFNPLKVGLWIAGGLIVLALVAGDR